MSCKICGSSPTYAKGMCHSCHSREWYRKTHPSSSKLCLECGKSFLCKSHVAIKYCEECCRKGNEAKRRKLTYLGIINCPSCGKKGKLIEGSYRSGKTGNIVSTKWVTHYKGSSCVL